MLTLAIGNPINSQKGIISLIRGAMSPNQQISQSLEASSQSMIYFNPLIPIFKKFLGMTHMIPHIKTLLELPSLFQENPLSLTFVLISLSFPIPFIGLHSSGPKFYPQFIDHQSVYTTLLLANTAPGGFFILMENSNDFRVWRNLLLRLWKKGKQSKCQIFGFFLSFTTS